ncbi:MAG: hypothetical protein M3Z05_22795 [Gemmatimonadota bacterium]|nr:hypothetical protein [Gemmatimonadota bacterium]
MTKLAIYKYHATGDADAARQHLRNLLGRFGDTGKKLSAEYELDTYIAWAERNDLIVADRKVRIEYDLGSGVLLGGEVSRVDVDVVGGGYRAILLGAHDPDWGAELRTPLLQRAVAQHFDRNESEVMVGVQSLDGTALETLWFTTAEIDEADVQARALAILLAAEWARQA